jgi:ssRNA-specific RNase YbeY (16S rRNA maturation enzyme)
LTTNKTIRAYNKKYRHIDKATDILSFPYFHDVKPGKKIIAQTSEDKQLGDLIISLEYVRKDVKRLLLRQGFVGQVETSFDVSTIVSAFAPTNGASADTLTTVDVSTIVLTTVDERMLRLLVHGICHLIGYDHETDEEYEVMLQKENELLAQLR